MWVPNPAGRAEKIALTMVQNLILRFGSGVLQFAWGMVFRFSLDQIFYEAF